MSKQFNLTAGPGWTSPTLHPSPIQQNETDNELSASTSSLSTGEPDQDAPKKRKRKIQHTQAHHRRIHRQAAESAGNPLGAPSQLIGIKHRRDSDEIGQRKKIMQVVQFQGEPYRALPHSKDHFVYTLEPERYSSLRNIETAKLALASGIGLEANKIKAQQSLKQALGKLLEHHPEQLKMIQALTRRALLAFGETYRTDDEHADDPRSLIRDTVTEYIDGNAGSYVLMSAIAGGHEELSSYVHAIGRKLDDYCADFVERFPDRDEEEDDIEEGFNGYLQTRSLALKDFLNNYGVDLNDVTLARGLTSGTFLDPKEYLTAALDKKLFWHNSFFNATTTLEEVNAFTDGRVAVESQSLVEDALQILDLRDDSEQAVAQRNLLAGKLNMPASQYNNGQGIVLLVTCKEARGAMLSKETIGIGSHVDERGIALANHVFSPQNLILGKNYHVILGEVTPVESLSPSLTSLEISASDLETMESTLGNLKTYSIDEVNEWLFNGASHPDFPESELDGREQEKHAPKVTFNSVKMVGDDKYTSRIGIYSGGITDLRTHDGETAAICSSNNGDLLTGCGYAIAKAVINAAGPGLQTDLYNEYGVPSVMDQPQFAKENYANTESRGYAITCNAHDMQNTHGVEAVEMLIVPMYDLRGLANMYKEALEHAKDKDYIALPMAGMSHPLLEDKPELSAQVAMKATKEFIDSHPESNLKIIFTIYEDKQSEELYRKQAQELSGH